MLLPNREDAYIPLPKLNSYLLSEAHVIGKSKAGFFIKFGFNKANVNLLIRGFLEIARTNVVKEVVSSPYGTKYIVDGKLKTPSDKVVTVRTVWIIETDDQRPRFVTAHPA